MAEKNVKPEGAPLVAPKKKTDPVPQKKRNGRGRVAIWVLGIVAALTVALVACAYFLQGRVIAAPDWVRGKIQTRLIQAYPYLHIAYGDVSVVFEADWRPRVRLRDIDVRDETGASIISLADIETTVALRPLLDGKIQPHSVTISGAQLALSRNRDGSFDLAFGNEMKPIGRGQTLAQLIEGLDSLFIDPQLAALKSIEADTLSVRYEDARARRGWSVDGGRIELNRAGDDLNLRGDFALLTGGDTAATLEMNYTSRIGAPSAAFGMLFEDMRAGDIASQGPALAWLGVLDAPISGSLRATVDDAGDVGPLNATLQIGAGAVQPNSQTLPIPFESMRSYFTYTPASQSLQFDELSLVSKWATVTIDGRAVLGNMDSGWPNELLAHFNINDIVTNPDDLYPTPISLEGASMDLRLRLDPFELDLGQLNLRDQGEIIRFDGGLAATNEGWNLTVQGQMAKVKSERLLELWPARVAPRTRDWVAKNYKSGDISNIQFGLKSKPATRPDIFLGFDFADVETRFLKAMPLLRGASGHATLYRDRFSVTADRGHVRAAHGGSVDISGTSFIVPNVRIKKGPAEIDLKTQSTVTAALTLLDRDPFNFLTKAGQTTTLADGRLNAQGKINIFMKEKLAADEIDFKISGKIRDVRSDSLVDGFVLAASELDLAVDTKTLSVSGAGRIGKVPFEGEFSAQIGENSNGQSKVSGWVELSQEFVQEFHIGLPDNSVSGAGRGEVTIDLARGKRPRFNLTSRLAGVGLRFAPLGWSLARKSRAKLDVSGTLGTPPSVDSLVLDAPGLYAKGKITLKPSGDLGVARFARVRAGDWLDSSVVLTGRGAGAAPSVDVTSGTIDLSKTAIGGPESSGSASQSGGPLTLSLRRLKISEGISLTDFRANFTTKNGMQGPFSGKVNGDTKINGTVVPKNGRSAFRIKSTNAGGVFRSSGLLEQARDGDLSLILVPSGKEGSYDGTLRVTDVRLVDAPSMIALLNAVSVVGLLEQTAGRGIHFAEVDGKFRLTPTQVIVTKSSAIGASLGVSMDGFYTLGSGKMKMQGVISPLYLLNVVGSVLTRKGEGLLGFNFKLLGTADNPKVKVNPLSILTPGMFREIFRRRPPKIDPQTGELIITSKKTRPVDPDRVQR